MRDLDAFQRWHELLDALCAEQGHHDNMALAEALCAASGNQTQAAFDAAVKNLQNWRQGVHTPQRRNFMLLGKVLKVDSHEGLREVWNRLYSAEKPARPAGAMIEAPPPDAQAREPKRRWFAALAGVSLVGALAAIAFILPLESPAESTGAPAENIVADYLPFVALEVGQSAIIHGARSRACGAAPTWERISGALPDLETGQLSDGGIATRYSRNCGERVEVRAILFTATQAGEEHVTLYGDAIEIQVTE